MNKEKASAIKMAIIKDRFRGVPQEEIDKALVIADAYGLDLALGHLVILKRRDNRNNVDTYNVYITRDGLLHLMHRMDKPWSLEVGTPERKKNPYTNKDDVWLSGRVIVHDSKTGFDQVISGGVWLSEYNSNRGPWKTHTASMHFKVVEVFLYRRATNVSLTPIEELDRVLTADSGQGEQGHSNQAAQPMAEATRDKVVAALKFAGFGTPELRAQGLKFFSAVVGADVPIERLADANEAQGRRFLNAIAARGEGEAGVLKRLRELSKKTGIEVPAVAEKPEEAEGETPQPEDSKEPEAKGAGESLDEAFPPPEAFDD